MKIFILIPLFSQTKLKEKVINKKRKGIISYMERF